MNTESSAEGLQTSLEVFPGTPAPLTYPLYTQKQLFVILDHVPYCDLVRWRDQKKARISWDLVPLKKNVAIINYEDGSLRTRTYGGSRTLKGVRFRIFTPRS